MATQDGANVWEAIRALGVAIRKAMLPLWRAVTPMLVDAAAWVGWLVTAYILTRWVLSPTEWSTSHLIVLAFSISFLSWSIWRCGTSAWLQRFGVQIPYVLMLLFLPFFLFSVFSENRPIFKEYLIMAGLSLALLSV